jgi:RNA polymerase sigma-70 factor (ECF subfamily)
MTELTDRELADRVWGGDERAFRVLFERYVRVLCEVAVSYVKLREVAQELVQDVFCRVWEQRDQMVPPDNVRAYLYAATRHRALDHLRHQRVVDQVSDAPFAPGEHPGIGEPVAGADEQLLARERRELLLRAIAELPERQRRVFELRWYHHLSYAEIGAVLDISAKGVESLRARAIEALQKKLRGVLG